MRSRGMEHADYAAAAASVRAALLAYAEQVWATASLSDEGLARLVELMVPQVMAAQIQLADFTAIYLAAATAAPVVAAPDVTAGRGVPPETVYARPIITARSELSKGKSIQKAMDAGRRRLLNLAGTDVQMAKVRQAQASLSRSGRKFYRRVPTGAENCAMCLIAATQRYSTNELMPIHPGCDCDTDVIPPGMDLDLVINPELLEATHDQVEAFAGIADRGGRAPDYRKLIVTREHGEVGPTLAWINQKFTGPADL